MQISWQEGAVLIAGGAALTAFLTLLTTRHRDRKVDVRQVQEEAIEEGARRAQLDSLLNDVSQLKDVELPAIRALTHQNAQAIAGLAAGAAAQAANLSTLVEKVDDLRDLHKEREDRFASMVDFILKGGQPGCPPKARE